VTHTNRFDLDLKFGQEKENELQEAIEGLVECKADRLCQKTGNVFVEIESRGKPSGIKVTKANYQAYCLVVPERKKDVWVLVPTSIVKKIMKNFPIKKGGDNFTSKGHIIPKAELLNLTLK
tara:strand:- start:9 stop:371 length:363 start_codon:yes stop_codon:yes gene_type:complete